MSAFDLEFIYGDAILSASDEICSIDKILSETLEIKNSLEVMLCDLQKLSPIDKIVLPLCEQAEKISKIEQLQSNFMVFPVQTPPRLVHNYNRIFTEEIKIRRELESALIALEQSQALAKLRAEKLNGYFWVETTAPKLRILSSRRSFLSLPSLYKKVQLFRQLSMPSIAISSNSDNKFY